MSFWHPEKFKPLSDILSGPCMNKFIQINAARVNLEKICMVPEGLAVYSVFIK